MKKYVYSSSSAYSIREVLKAMQRLQDAMESTPSGTLDKYELGDLYEELTECIYDLSHMIDE